LDLGVSAIFSPDIKIDANFIAFGNHFAHFLAALNEIAPSAIVAPYHVSRSVSPASRGNSQSD